MSVFKGVIAHPRHAEALQSLSKGLSPVLTSRAKGTWPLQNADVFRFSEVFPETCDPSKLL